MKYNAFISYRHAELDIEIAKKLHKGLETFKIPRSVQKKYGIRRIARVFRDQEELPIGSDLTDNISVAIEDSQFLIVVCSPRTPGSEWVLKEIDTFIEKHDRQHVLAILIEGEPSESFPPQLLVDEEGNPVEPLAADVRGETAKERSKKLKTEIMRLCAPLIGCTYDELRQRHRERKIRRIAYISMAIAALAIAFGAYATYETAKIQENYMAKLENQTKYLASSSAELLRTGDRRAAALLAAEGLSLDEDQPFVPAAAYALAEALHVYDPGDYASFDRCLTQDMNVKDFYLNKEATKIASWDFEGNVYLWDVATGEKIGYIPVTTEENGTTKEIKAAYPIGENVLIVFYQSIGLYDMNGKAIWEKADEVRNTYVSYYEEKDIVGVVDVKNGATFYTGATGEILAQIGPEEDDDLLFAQAPIFSFDGNRVAVIRNISMSTDGYDDIHSCKVTVFDFETCEVIDYITKESYIYECVFTTDYGLAVVSAHNSDAVSMDFGGTYEMYVTFYDLEGEEEWNLSFQRSRNIYADSITRILQRDYVSPDDHLEYDRLFLVINDTVYTIDKQEGEVTSTVSFGDYISNIHVPENSHFGFVGLGSGTIAPVNLETGTVVTTSNIETDLPISDFSIGTGVICVRATSDNRLYLIKYLESDNMEVLAENVSRYYAGYCSKAGTYQAYPYYGTSESVFDFYKNDEFISSLEVESAVMEVSGFISETEFMGVSGRASVTIIDLENGTTDEYKLEDVATTWFVDSPTLSPDGRYLVFYYGSSFAVFDTVNKTFSEVRDIFDESDPLVTVYVHYMVVSNDGSTVYANCKNLGLVKYEMSSDKLTKIPDVNLYAYDRNAGALLISNDGTRLLVRCADGTIRILDTASFGVVDTINLNTGSSEYFVAFSADDQDLIIQGRDGYLRVYSLLDDEYTYFAESAGDRIVRIYTDEESGLSYTFGFGEMRILDNETMEPLAVVDRGKTFCPATGMIYSYSQNRLVTFKYMPVKALLAELKNQFPGEGLSDEERLRYHSN